MAECLEGLAAVARAEGRPRRAAHLWGAAEALRAARGAPLPPCEQGPYERDVAAARTRLGAAGFAAAWAQGRGTSLEEAVAAALEPETPAPPPAAPPEAARRGGGGPAGLTPREREVARLVARGLSNREIAAALVITRRTAETHVDHILTKLGLRTRAQIAAWAVEHGALPAPPGPAEPPGLPGPARPAGMAHVANRTPPPPR
jgi:non-specific serine/threonine protein kinase